MRIAFVGKGGSGKTTIASLLVNFLIQGGFPVLAIDADINQHLAAALDLTITVPPMGNEILKIKEYVRGANRLLSDVSKIIKTTPPGIGSKLMKLRDNNPIFDYFSHTDKHFRFMATGPFVEDDIGVSCYHSKTGSVELLLNHLIDAEDEHVVIDMTAGADSFASGIFTKFDLTVVVVEPTLKSIAVFNQYLNYAKEYQVNVVAVGNKVQSNEDIDFLKTNLGGYLIATIIHSQFIRNKEQGAKIKQNIEPEIIKALEKIKAILDATNKDWQKHYDQAVHFHKLNAVRWANSSMGEDLTRQIDNNFDFASSVLEMKGGEF